MKKWFAFLDNDKVLLVVSLLAAVVLWMVVISDRNPTDTDFLRDIDVTYINSENIEASGMNIISMSSDSVDVKISGRLTELQQITKQNVAASIDMSEILSPGNYNLDVKVTQTKSGINIESIEPKTITVRVDYIETNKRDVEVNLIGELPENVEIVSAMSSVTSVTIEGPEKTLDTISKAVATVDVSEITDSCSVNAAIKLIDSTGMEITDKEVKISSASATVDIDVAQLKTVPVQIILSGEVDVGNNGIHVAATPENVIIKGKKDVLKEIDKIDTEAILHIPEASAVISAKPVLPEGVSCDTETINITFTIENSVANINEN